MLALGAAFLTLSTEYEPAINALLFGEILGVSVESKCSPSSCSASCASLAILALFRPLVFTSVAPDLAAAKGVNATLVEIGVSGRARVVDGAHRARRRRAPDVLAHDRPTRRGAPALHAPPGACLSVVLALATVWVSIACSVQFNLPIGFFVGTFGRRALPGRALWTRPPGARPRCVTYGRAERRATLLGAVPLPRPRRRRSTSRCRVGPTR